jgi:GNAT superfamily N-acetyltransferase
LFPRSLALLTDLGVLASRARITVRRDYIVVETPDQPGWTDGNFLVLQQRAAPGELAQWCQRFQDELGARRAVSLRCDDAGGKLADEAELRSAGFSLDLHQLMVADEVRAQAPSPLPTREIAPHELDATCELAWQISDRHDEAYRAFLAAHARWLASTVADGRARFVGAFDGTTLVASLGVFPIGTIARYQQVQTHPSYRRRGLAGTLLAQAAGLCTGVERFAILAELDSAAAGMYGRVGFRAVELTARATRFPTSARGPNPEVRGPSSSTG